MQTIKLRQTTQSNGVHCMSKSDTKGVTCALKIDAKVVPWTSKSTFVCESIQYVHCKLF